jgi:DNA-binding response OmpR family regulator
MPNPPRSATTSPRALVDDEPTLVRVVVVYLQADGFVVDSAADVPTALELARRTDPDVIVLDLGLPGMDGWRSAARSGRSRTPMSS